jgi:ubiquinone/menaquinone biosynthesis C-methylase UbiE
MKTHPIIEEYGRLASDYDARWSFYVEATTRETLARLTLRPGERLLDVGCGTGALLHRLSRSPGVQLTGVDPVPEMLAVARRRLRTGWAEQLPFDRGQFDVVVSCNAFHYFRDPVAALCEIGWVLAPGGRLVLTDWCDDYLACRVCDLYLRLVNRAHVKVYRRQECLRLLQEAGYRDVAVERYKINWLWDLMTATGSLP